MDNKSSREIADALGISVRQVQRLTLDGTIEGVSDARPYRYNLETVTRQYCAFLAEKLKAQDKSNVILALEESKLRAEVDIQTAKAEAAQLELDEMRGKLHRAEDVEAITTDHVLFLRSMLMAMPGKLAVDLAGNHTAAEQAERVKKEVYFILNQLADYRYDPDVYKQRVMERQGWSSGVEINIDA